jgi:hypothetical protein
LWFDDTFFSYFSFIPSSLALFVCFNYQYCSQALESTLLMLLLPSPLVTGVVTKPSAATSVVALVAAALMFCCRALSLASFRRSAANAAIMMRHGLPE